MSAATNWEDVYRTQTAHIAELERENAALRNEVARLNNQTNWVCSCGGTDCAGQKENAALRQALEAMPTCRCGLSTDEQCDLSVQNAALRADKERLDWIIGEAHYLFFKELASDLAKGRQQIDAARKEAQP